MNELLFISPINPFAPDNGSSLRIAALLSELVKTWRVTLLCLSKPGLPKSPPASLREKLNRVFVLQNCRSKRLARIRWATGHMPYRSYLSDFSAAPNYRQAISEIKTGRFDRVVCVEQESLPVLNDLGVDPAIGWLDIHNWYRDWCESFATSGSITRRLYGKISLWKQVRFEKRFFRMVENVICVSDEDRISARAIFPNHRFEVVPNGVGSQFFDAGGRIRQRSLNGQTSDSVLFVGSLDVEMNIVGVEWLVKTVWPHVRAENPSLKLHLVGRSPAQRVTRLQSDDVNLFGNVADVLPHYENAGSVVVPVFVGGGSKLKVLEALATGLPIVSTRFGVVGLPDTVLERIQIEDDPIRFAAAILRMHNQPAIPPNSALHEYNWTVVCKKFDDLLQCVTT